MRYCMISVSGRDKVCFPQIGRVIFLDANASPRTIMPLE